MNEGNAAADLLQQAAKIVGSERGQQHGDVERTFEMVGQLWRTYLDHARHVAATKGQTEHISAFDVAQMLILLKLVRALYGDRNNSDHFVDAAGYAALAGALATKQNRTIVMRHTNINANGGSNV